MQRIIFTGAFCLMVGAGPAMAGEAFKRLEGQWAGKGTIEFSNKTKETLRCRASYDVLQSGANLQLAIRCAGDSYRIELMGNASDANGRVCGCWCEATLNLSGTLSGSAEGSSIRVTAASPAFTASFGVVTNGGRQTVSIRSQTPDSTIHGATISLARN